MKIPSETESAMDSIDLAICDCAEIDSMNDDHLTEFYKWAGEHFLDYADVDGIDGVEMLRTWQEQKAESNRDDVEGLGDYLCHLYREG